MAQHSSQLSQRDSSKSLFNRRHYLFFALLAITTPFFLQAVAGASVHTNVTTNSIASTGEALELLTRPHSYHGVVHTASSGRNKVRQELSEQPAGKVKNKMNGDLYPVKDSIPDVNHPQVKAWVAEIDWSKVPKIPVAPGLADAPHFPKCPPDSQVDKSSCWWSCGGCVQPSDIMTCPNTLDWGLTYDDGPSEATKDMMTHLNSKNLKATFFIVGSRVLEYPEILKEEVAQGHHIAMHTWSHCGLTTLTNEQIVAEVRWTEKIIRDVTGLTMKYIRPPYGDVDNRVREILRQMGYSTVIWTLGWDTNDWRVALRQIQVPEIIKTFKNALDNRAFIKSPAGLPAGPITLEHDLTDDTIELAKQIIPMGMSTGLQPKSLAQCLNDNNPYRGQPQPKQNGNKNGISGSAKPAPGSGSVASNGSTGNSDADGSSKDDVNGGSSTSSAGNAAVTIMAPNGSQAMGYISMGLAVVASYMLAL